MDPTQFRERFKAWKDGKKPYKDGLPAYGDGKQTKKKWKYTPSDTVRSHIAKWEDSDFAEQNKLFGGDAVGAKAIEFANAIGEDIGRRLTSKELDGIFSTFYNLSPKTFNEKILPSIKKYAMDPNVLNRNELVDTMSNRYTLAALKYQKGIKRRAAADTALTGLTKVEPQILEYKTKDGNKVMKFDYGQLFLPQPIPKPIPETQYPLSGSQAPESISSWNAALSPSATPTIPSIQKLNNERLKAVQGAFLLPEVTVYGLRRMPTLLPKLPSLNDALMAYSPLNLMNRAVSEMMRLDDLWEDMDVTSDLFKAKNGKLPKYKDGKDDDFESFRRTLPDNQKNTPEYMYRTRRYWELNGKPKNFGEAIGRGMYTYEGDGWHANSVSYNENTGEYEFMKPNYHNTKMMEDAWYYSKDGEEFRNLYTKSVDPTGIYDKYIPKKKKGLIGLKNGKLPRYNTGLVPGLTEEHSDNTRVVRPEIHLPVKRQPLKKLVTTEQMLLATENKPVVKRGENYTQRRIKEETKHVPEEVYSTLTGIGIGSDIVGKLLGLPPIYSSLKAAKELSEGNIISGSLWALPFISEAKPAIAAELGPWWNAEKTWGKNFKFNNDLYYRSVNLDKGSMPLSAIDDANNTGIIRSLNKSFNGRPYFSVGLYENTSFPQASRNNAIIQADPNLHEFVSVGDFSHAIQQDAKILPGGTVMPIIKTPSATFPGGDLRSGAFSYWTPESLFGLKYWRNRNFTPNVNSALLLYIDALKSGNMLEAQNIIDNTYLQNVGSGAILNSFGEAENLVHTVGDSYKPGFRVFDPNIEGQNSFIYTTDAEGRPMSNSYTSKFLTRLQAETNALSRFNRYIKELENDIKYLKESIDDPNETSPLKESWKRAVKRKEDELTNKRVLIYNNFLEENLRKLDPDRELRLYGRLNNPVIVDAEGKGWNSFLGPDAFGGKTEMSTRELEKLIQTANEVGFGTNLGANPGIIDGAIIKNVVDYGGKKITDPMMTPHTVFEFASPKQLKLSRPVTFTEDNLGVWPWLRFDWNNPDMHFANGKSPIYIKPANRGKLTKLKLRTGKSESELYNDGNPAHKKMVVFARNARKWKH